MAAKARLRLDGADPINRGLLGFWPLQDPAGQIWADISPNRWDARPGTAPNHRATPKIGTSGSFNGSTQYLTTASPSHPGSTGAHSVVAWVRPNFSSASNTVYNVIIRGTSTDNGQRLVWVNSTIGWYSDNVSASVGAYFNTGASTPAFSANEWHLLVFVYNNGGQFYWDGKAVSTAGPSAAWPNANLSGLPFYIGRDVTASQYWLGELALIRQYTRALTPTEIQRLYRDPWAGTARPVRRGYSAANAYSLTLDNVAREYGAGALGLTAARRLALDGVSRVYGAGAANLTVTRTLALDGVSRVYGAGDITLTKTRPMALDGVSRLYGADDMTMTYDGTGAGPHGVLRRRVRRRLWNDVPEDLKPVVALAEEWADESPVQRAVDEAVDRYARISARASIARRDRLVDELKRAIVQAVERAAEADDEEALIALL